MDVSPLRPPLAAPLPRTEPQRRLWGPVTVRCAWELLLAGVSPRTMLRAARDHALLLLPDDANLPEAEALASAATRDLVARERGVYAPWAPDADLSILPDPRWREAIQACADPIHDAVFRLHFADGLPLDGLDRRTGLDRSVLRAAREALIELAREILVEDGLPVHEWEPTRLERLVYRIATAAGDLCPGPGGLATDQGRAHAEGCPRCSRALRLIREGVISPSDLFPPEDGPVVPQHRVDALLVQLHPDARKHRRALDAALGPARQVNREVWVVDLAADPGVLDRLRPMAEEGAPPAGRLRLLRRPILGRFAGNVVLGGDVLTACDELQRLEWGAAAGVEPLPEPLPPPPSAARWWMTALVVGLMATAAGTWALLPAPPPPDVALEAQRTGEGVRFDTDDAAYVDVLALRGGTLSLVAHSERPGDKGAWATGDGRYALPVDADQVFVVARSTSLEDMDRLVDGFVGETATAAEVRRRLRDRFPGAAIEDVP